MLTVPPILEPFTLIEAKLRAGLDWAPGDPREPILTGFIATARSQVERDTGVACFTQTRVESLARHAGSCRAIDLPWRPVQTVTIATLDTESYVLDPSSVDPIPARLRLVSGTWAEDLVATIVVGHLTVAAFQAQAPGLMFAIGQLIAHYATLGRDLASVDPAELVPMGYADAIAPYQLVVVP